MATKLHPAKWGPADRSWEKFIGKLVADRGYGHEREYFGIETRERADEVRRGLYNVGRRSDEHSVKAYWRPCAGCEAGGPSCRFHVRYTAYAKEAARAYKEAHATRP
jgi:hypothetical protein